LRTVRIYLSHFRGPLQDQPGYRKADGGPFEGLRGADLAQQFKRAQEIEGKLLGAAVIIETTRLRLRPWREGDRGDFAAMHADPDVTVDYASGPLGRAQSNRKLDRYAFAFEQLGFCRWAVETPDGRFVGYTGVMPSREGHPLGAHYELGWRLMRSEWGRGYATEAAKAALKDVFQRAGLSEVLAYAAADNTRSQAVMARLDLRRDPRRDFIAEDNAEPWAGLVWVASL